MRQKRQCHRQLLVPASAAFNANNSSSVVSSVPISQQQQQQHCNRRSPSPPPPSPTSFSSTAPSLLALAPRKASTFPTAPPSSTTMFGVNFASPTTLKTIPSTASPSSSSNPSPFTLNSLPSPLHRLSTLLCLFLLALFLCLLIPATHGQQQQTEQIRQKCLSAVASRTCGTCISTAPECAWCADSRLNSTQRCDAKWEFADGKCPERQLFSPNTEIKVAPQHNLPLGSRRSDGVTVIQLEPQQVEIRMKPGDVVEVPFRYLHKLPLNGYEVRDFTIQTSEFRSLGIDIEFSVDCNGERIVGRVCPGVRPEQRIAFYAKVSLADCSRPQLAAVSVGIYGYNTVSAIFVTPLCGCDCEQPRQQERRSPRCSYVGNLVCGSCQCDPGKGGERCECDLDKYGVSNADELVGLCREHNKAAICSGNGKCQCGQCQCQADYISGRYCECDNTNCPLNAEGRMCSARGACQCGKCVCEHGYSGEDCGCDDDPEPCTENGVVCFNNGYCECGKCACSVGWTGAKCNVPEPLPEEYTTTTTTPGEDEDESSTTTTTSTAAGGEIGSEEEAEPMRQGGGMNDNESEEELGGPKSAELLPTHGTPQYDTQHAQATGGDSSGRSPVSFWPVLIGTGLSFFLGIAYLAASFP